MGQTIGRNDPCWCGSGKKYKHCHLASDEQASADTVPPGLEDFREAIRHWSATHPDASRREAEEFIQGSIQTYNERPQEDLAGLSPAQMRRLFGANDAADALIEFPCKPVTGRENPAFMYCMAIASMLIDGKVRPTAKGNLPRAVCKSIIQRIFGEEEVRRIESTGGKFNEEEETDLHVVHIVAKEAELIVAGPSRLLPSLEVATHIIENDMSSIYQKLIQAYVARFNWAYLDWYPDLKIIQDSLPFSLYLLNRYGTEPRSYRFYEDAFLRAFPQATEGVESNPYITAESFVRRAYTNRMFRYFCYLFGLITIESGERFGDDFSIFTTPLFHEVVKFNLL